ncbi:MAG: zinc-ribbon domain-containing protein [Clostridia bacterium]|nr:zinc-ribbon domain-containing protein [Clostridia bacterium]
MFCKNCGKEIDDKATVCVHCGVPTANAQTQQVVTGGQSNGFAIAGFVLSLFGGILGLIFSIIGLQKSKLPEYNGNGRGLAIAGIVISSIALFGYVLGIGLCSAGACVLGSTTPSSALALLPLV